jgi:hypothetical protein
MLGKRYGFLVMVFVFVVLLVFSMLLGSSLLLSSALSRLLLLLLPILDLIFWQLAWAWATLRNQVARSAAYNRRSVGRCGRASTADPPTWTNVATEAELVITKAKSETAYLPPHRPVVRSLSSTPEYPVSTP